MHAHIDREPLHLLKRFGHVGEAIVSPERHRAPLRLLQRTNRIGQKLHYLAIDDGFSVGEEKTGGVMGCAGVLELEKGNGLEMTIDLTVLRQIFGMG